MCHSSADKWHDILSQLIVISKLAYHRTYLIPQVVGECFTEYHCDSVDKMKSKRIGMISVFASSIPKEIRYSNHLCGMLLIRIESVQSLHCIFPTTSRYTLTD